MRRGVLWAGVTLALVVPIGAAALSPYLAYRQPIYIAAGFAGIGAFGLLLVQPLLAGGVLAGPRWRRAHRWCGAAIVVLVLLHLVGLWITSPPDVVDALLLQSPTPFSVWGVLALLATLAVAGLALVRRRLRPRVWARWHLGLTALVVAGTLPHALLIEGTMEPVTKALLALAVGLATGWLLFTRLRRDRAPLAGSRPARR